jgi:hypothetical protein
LKAVSGLGEIADVIDRAMSGPRRDFFKNQDKSLNCVEIVIIHRARKEAPECGIRFAAVYAMTFLSGTYGKTIASRVPIVAIFLPLSGAGEEIGRHTIIQVSAFVAMIATT